MSRIGSRSRRDGLRRRIAGGHPAQNWSGAKAADLFHTRHADWHPAAQRQWERLTGDRRAD
jgi:phenylacetic acid degradation operon negative regulatory protein